MIRFLLHSHRHQATTQEKDDESKLDKFLFDDSEKLIDHYAYQLRIIPVEFFRIALLTQISTIFAIFSILIAKEKKIPQELIGDVKAITLSLAFGIFFSLLGYGLLYYSARSNTLRVRKNLNRFLHKSGRIKRNRLNSLNKLVQWMAALVALDLVIILYIIYRFVAADIILLK